MKLVIAKYFILLIVLCLSCGNYQKPIKEMRSKTFNIICPDDGICTFEVLKNQSLEILQDDIGSLYPQILDGKKIILKFEYKRNEIPNTSDGNYSELIYLEVNPNNLELKLKNSELKNVKLLFARLCYCKGQTGYYIIDKGNLSIKKKSGNTFNLSLQFSTDEVPQIITEINETFQLIKQ